MRYLLVVLALLSAPVLAQPASAPSFLRQLSETRNFNAATSPRRTRCTSSAAPTPPSATYGAW